MATLYVDDAQDITPTREANPGDVVVYRAPAPQLWLMFQPLEDDPLGPIPMINGGLSPSNYKP